jgi:SAM-dependent methyltransferase
MPRRSEFDEEGYLQLYPDIAQGVSSGAIESGWSHFARSGFAEGRPWLRRPDPMAGVSHEISPRDEMFGGNEAHYFDVGESALHCIETALFAARRPRSTIRRILDLPCGHGRALRFFKRAFPDAELVACDLDRDGVDFCARTFGATPEYSHENVDEISHQGVVDLIWCGSLLTHLSEEKCRAFLRFFHRILGHRGIVVLTLHGRFCERELASGRNRHGIDDGQIAELLRGYRERGFSYVPYEARADYGFSLAHPAFVTRHLIDSPTWRLLGYHETGWDKRQDVISLQKSLGGLALGI